MIAKTLSSITDGKIIGRRHFNLSFLEWKDDCKSAKSNKQSKFGIWLFTITIFMKTCGRDSPLGTYPVAVGPKGSSHDEVEQIIGDDIARMRTEAIRAIVGWSMEGSPYHCTFSGDLYMSLGVTSQNAGQQMRSNLVGQDAMLGGGMLVITKNC